MSDILRLVLVCGVLAFFVWLVQRSSLPSPFVWIAWIIIFIIALLALTPMIGVHLPA